MDSKGKSDVILQDWNEFGFKYIEKCDYQKILASLHQNFYLDEPMCKVLGLTPERVADMNEKATDILNLNQGSFYAYPLDQPDKVAALLMIWIHEEGKDLPRHEERSPLSGLVRKARLQLKSRYDIHAEQRLKIYPEIFVISTDRIARGKGLATEMYRKTIAKFRAEGYPIVASTFSNPLSRKIGEKLGFETVARIEFDECVNDDGSPIFGPGGEGHFIVETVLELK